MQAGPLQALPVVMALELSPGEQPRQLTLSRDAAAELATFVAQDLHALLPEVAQCRLVLAGVLLDAVELLRPGFPVWAALDDLARRVPRGQLENVVAFGSHAGQMPAPSLAPDPHYAGGPMRFLPLTLLVPDELADALSQQLEAQLAARGEAGTRTSDWLMRQLGARLEHARFLTRNDLLALTCVQYEHVNLAPLWQLLEAALLTPYREEKALSARGLALRYANGKVSTQSPAQWLAQQSGSMAERSHAFAGVLFELRQYSALLEAHGMALQLDTEAASESQLGGAVLIETLALADPERGTPVLFAHEAQGLGVIAITAAQRGPDGHMCTLAHAYLLQPASVDTAVAAMISQFSAGSEVHATGHVHLDERGLPGVPAGLIS